MPISLERGRGRLRLNNSNSSDNSSKPFSVRLTTNDPPAMRLNPNNEQRISFSSRLNTISNEEYSHTNKSKSINDSSNSTSESMTSSGCSSPRIKHQSNNSSTRYFRLGTQPDQNNSSSSPNDRNRSQFHCHLFSNMFSLDENDSISPENSQQIHRKSHFVIREYREKSPTPISYYFPKPFTDEDVCESFSFLLKKKIRFILFQLCYLLGSGRKYLNENKLLCYLP
jgi:hypothetical protein